jgi:hypothetical protein
VAIHDGKEGQVALAVCARQLRIAHHDGLRVAVLDGLVGRDAVGVVAADDARGAPHRRARLVRLEARIGVALREGGDGARVRAAWPTHSDFE